MGGEGFEEIAVEVKETDTKLAWEIIGIYRAPNEDMRVKEMLAKHTDSLRKSMKRSIIGGDLNLSHAHWKGNVDDNSRGQRFIYRFVWENGYTQVFNGAVRGDALHRGSDPKISFTLAQ
jgi:hypothetical protein